MLFKWHISTAVPLLKKYGLVREVVSLQGEIWPDKKGGLWLSWPDKKGGLWLSWPDKKGDLWLSWPDKKGGLWLSWPDKKRTNVHTHTQTIMRLQELWSLI